MHFWKNASLILKANNILASRGVELYRCFDRHNSALKCIRESILFLCLINFPFHLHSQLSKTDLHKIDQEVLFFSEKKENNFDSLIYFVKRNYPSDEKKVRAFYTWIANNISYDKELLDNYKISAGWGLKTLSSDATQNPDTVLKYRKAVCEGFSLLMNKCCKKVSIVSKMVVGVTKLEDDNVMEKIMHTWNAVKLDTTWYLLDLTWSNGYVNLQDKYIKKFSGDLYFFTPPAQFVNDHWPLDAMWQLLYYPVSKDEFYNNKNPAGKNFVNFNDSIKAYLKIPAGELEYVDFLHYHNYDPENKIYTLGCDHYIYNKAVDLFNLAAIYFGDYSTFVKKLEGKPINKKDLLKCIKLLNEPRTYLEKGLKYSANKTFFNTEVKEELDEIVTYSSLKLAEINSDISRYKKLANSLK